MSSGCEAVIRRVETAFGSACEDVTYPEKDLQGPPVEVRFRIGETRFAIEHILVEPFAEATRSGKEFEELVLPLHDDLDGTLSKPGTYRLKFTENPTSGLPRKKHAALRAKITAWVRDSAAAMHAERPDRIGRDRLPYGYNGMRETEIDGIELRLERVVHWRENGRHDGWLFRCTTFDLNAQTYSRYARHLT